MAGSGPGEQKPVGERGGRRLAQPPSARYASAAPAGGAPAGDAQPGTARAAAPSSLPGPLARAGIVAVAGALGIWLLGAVLASTAGLLIVAASLGTGIGLLLARAAVPATTASSPTPRPTVVRLAVGLAVAAVAVASLLTWLYARQEGGTLGLLEYLWTTFGLLIPAELGAAAVTAWWGASAGPVQR